MWLAAQHSRSAFLCSTLICTLLETTFTNNTSVVLLHSYFVLCHRLRGKDEKTKLNSQSYFFICIVFFSLHFVFWHVWHITRLFTEQSRNAPNRSMKFNKGFRIYIIFSSDRLPASYSEFGPTFSSFQWIKASLVALEHLEFVQFRFFFVLRLYKMEVEENAECCATLWYQNRSRNVFSLL